MQLLVQEIDSMFIELCTRGFTMQLNSFAITQKNFMTKNDQSTLTTQQQNIFKRAF